MVHELAAVWADACVNHTPQKHVTQNGVGGAGGTARHVLDLIELGLLPHGIGLQAGQDFIPAQGSLAHLQSERPVTCLETRSSTVWRCLCLPEQAPNYLPAVTDWNTALGA